MSYVYIIPYTYLCVHACLCFWDCDSHLIIFNWALSLHKSSLNEDIGDGHSWLDQMNRPVLQGYQQFLDLALDAGLLAQNGLVLADNVLFRGLVAKVPQRNCTEVGQSSTRLWGIAEKLHRFNLHFLQEDPRTEGLILNQDDGLAIIWRRSWCAFPTSFDGGVRQVEWHGASLELVMRCYARKKASEQERGGLLNCLLRVSAMIWVFGGLGAFSCFASLLLCSLLGHLWTCRLIGLPTSGSVQVFQPKGRRFAQAIQA